MFLILVSLFDVGNDSRSFAFARVQQLVTVFAVFRCEETNNSFLRRSWNVKG